MKNPSTVRLRSLSRRFYPIPEALLGYLLGILTALASAIAPLPYSPLPFRSALSDALSAELPFLAAAALPLVFRVHRLVGQIHIFIRSACFGFGATLLASTAYPSLIYFQYVTLSLMLTALYACLFRQAIPLFENKRLTDRQAALEYGARWLFYSGTALLLLPLKYITGF